MLISTFSLILFPIYIYVCSNRMTKYSPQTPREQAKNAQGNESCRWVCSTAQLSLVPCWRFCLLDICVHSPRMPLARKSVCSTAQFLQVPCSSLHGCAYLGKVQNTQYNVFAQLLQYNCLGTQFFCGVLCFSLHECTIHTHDGWRTTKPNNKF